MIAQRGCKPPGLRITGNVRFRLCRREYCYLGGIFLISDATPWQNLYFCLECGCYADFTDADLIYNIQTVKTNRPNSLWDTTIEIHDVFGNPKMPDRRLFLHPYGHLSSAKTLPSFFGRTAQLDMSARRPKIRMVRWMLLPLKFPTGSICFFYFLRNTTISQGLVMAEGTTLVWARQNICT